MDWQHILDRIDEGIIVLDENNRVSYLNQSAQPFLKKTADQAIGEPLDVVLVEWIPLDQSHAQEMQTITCSPERSEQVYAVSIAPLHDGKQSGRLLKISDLTEQTAQAKALALAQKQAKAALQIKSNFLDIMSHELRTPLNAVVGYINILRNTPLNQEQVGIVNSMLTNGDKLTGIITNLLEYAEAEADHYELHPRPFDLNELLRSVTAPYEAALQEKSIVLEHQIAPGLPAFFIGDPLRIRQVLNYLVDNAAKYTEEGYITVSAAADKADGGEYRLRLTIRDTGVGIPTEMQDRLFQTFSQIDNSLTRRFGGLGLSLAIAQKISAHMGGSLRVNSEKGTGSTFVFTLPLKQSHVQPVKSLNDSSLALKNKKILLVGKNAQHRRTISRDVKLAGMKPYVASSTVEAKYWINKDKFDVICLESEVLEEDPAFCTEVKQIRHYAMIPLVLICAAAGEPTQENTFSAVLKTPFTTTDVYEVLIRATRKAQTSQLSLGETSATSQMADHHPLSILLVEDNAINQKVTTRMLARLGYRVQIATNGQIAFEMVQSISFDVLLMDIQMPVMDGVEATKKIRSLGDAIQQPQIVAVTAHARRGDRERYLAAGMNDYISKPIKMDKLVQSLYICKSGSSTPDDARTSAASEADPVSAGINYLQLEKLFGNSIDAFLAEMGPTFLEDSRHLLEDIESALRAGNHKALQASAHTLRGASASLGMERLAQLSRKLEKDARFDEAMILDELWRTLQSEHSHVVKELEARLISLSVVKA